MQIMKQALYLQATMAGQQSKSYLSENKPFWDWTVVRRVDRVVDIVAFNPAVTSWNHLHIQTESILIQSDQSAHLINVAFNPAVTLQNHLQIQTESFFSILIQYSGDLNFGIQIVRNSSFIEWSVIQAMQRKIIITDNSSINETHYNDI